MGRTNYSHGRKRGQEFTCGQVAKFMVIAAVMGLLFIIIMNMLPYFGL